MKINYKKTTLKNGVRVIVVPDKNAKTTSIRIDFGVGSRYEEKEISGTAHFLEHMAFKGTKKRPTSLDISKEMDGIGGDNNASTGKQRTRYWVHVPAHHFELGMDLLADILKNSLLNPKEIQKEKGIIKEEIKMYHDDPASFRNIKSAEQIFGDTPLGRDTAGTYETVDAVTRKQLIDFMRHFYRPDNMVISIAGKVSFNKALRETRKHFGSLRGRVVKSYEPNTVAQLFPSVLVYKRDIEQALIDFSFRSFGSKHKQRYARTVLATILGGYSSSLLFTEIREKRGLAYAIGSDVSSYYDTGIVTVWGGLTAEKLLDATKAIMQLLRKVRKDGFSDKDIRMAKENAVGGTLMGLDSPHGIASTLASQELFDKEIVTPEEYIAHIKKVTNRDLKTLARELFQAKNCNITVVGPLNPKEYEQKLLGLVKL